MGSVAGGRTLDSVVGRGVILGKGAMSIYSRTSAQGNINSTGITIAWNNTILEDSRGSITRGTNTFNLKGNRRYYCYCVLADARDGGTSGETGFKWVITDAEGGGDVPNAATGGAYNTIDSTDTKGGALPDTPDVPAIAIYRPPRDISIKVVTTGGVQNFSPDLGSKVIIYEI